MPGFDALLIVSFGGPEKREDVIPFLENVLRGRDVPRARLLAVAEHYYHFDGISPINQQTLQLVEALRRVLPIPVYWGNRNWHPMLAETIGQMQRDGVGRALALATSAFGSYSGCRQYVQNIKDALVLVANLTVKEPDVPPASLVSGVSTPAIFSPEATIARFAALAGRHQMLSGEPSLESTQPAPENPPLNHPVPEIVKLRPFGLHPLFIEAMADRVRPAVTELPGAQLVFTAHSIPLSMAQTSPYVKQLETASRRVAEAVGVSDWKLVYQSRSGPPSQPWLGPDICDHLREIRKDTVIAPIGFVSDHMEVLYDLDTEARAVANELGIRMIRTATVGTHPAIITLIAELVDQALKADPEQCPVDCCPAPQRR